ncbi:MAG: heme NO-binding protein [Cereibacter sphaeroides]|uniref:Heme NO-binding protein n=1 Tax=Cereibacter sphaeroides TaxID=1063 RepID=A0A2W5SEG5_CERSP|nr:MAG: heme NO-binding protein [Cereibacter sphaeroides]
MHGLINRSIQVFLRDTYGEALWTEVAVAADLGFDGFESMLRYDDRLTRRVIDAAAARLNRPRETVLEDLGTYLVSHPNLERLRRLLRFGGVDFVDFLHSLDELPGRGRMAVPDLDLPFLELRGRGPERFLLICRSPLEGIGHVIVGLLRAMADDYGALVVLEHQGSGAAGEVVSIHLLEQRFAAGRRFEPAARAG